MENHRVHGPTIVLKVNNNLQCCKACPPKIMKKLEKIKGVKSITIDVAKGTVVVSGDVGPDTLIKAISKLKKKAELVPNKKDPRAQKKPAKQAQRSFKNKESGLEAEYMKKFCPGVKNKDCGGHFDSDSGSDDDENNDDHIRRPMNSQRRAPFVAPPHGKGYFPRAQPEFQTGRSHGHRDYWGRRPPPPPPPPPPPEYAYNYHSSVVPPQPPPPPYMRHYYYSHQPRKPPVNIGNSMFHYLSDDYTTSACSIM